MLHGNDFYLHGNVSRGAGFLGFMGFVHRCMVISTAQGLFFGSVGIVYICMRMFPGDLFCTSIGGVYICIGMFPGKMLFLTPYDFLHVTWGSLAV